MILEVYSKVSLTLAVVKLQLHDGILHLLNSQNLIFVNRFVCWKTDFQFGIVNRYTFAYVSVISFAQGVEVNRGWAVWMRVLNLILFADLHFVLDPFCALVIAHLSLSCTLTKR